MNPYDTSKPAWISASTADVEFRTRAFIRLVYAWMAGGLVLTAFALLAIPVVFFIAIFLLGEAAIGS